MRSNHTGDQYAGLSGAERAAAMVDPHISLCDAPTISECISCTGRVGTIRRVLAAGTPELEGPWKTAHAIDSDVISEATRLLEYALHLRMHGENAPGGTETWAQFDRDCEHFLRTTRPNAPQGDTVASLRATLARAEAEGWSGWACCEFHDADSAPCAPDDQGGYCCDNCPRLTGTAPYPGEAPNA